MGGSCIKASKCRVAIWEGSASPFSHRRTVRGLHPAFWLKSSRFNPSFVRRSLTLTRVATESYCSDRLRGVRA